MKRTEAGDAARQPGRPLQAAGSPLPAIRHPGIIQRPVIRAALRAASRCANTHDITDARLLMMRLDSASLPVSYFDLKKSAR